MTRHQKLGGAAVALLAIIWSLAPAMSRHECMTKYNGKGHSVRHFCKEQSSWGWKW